MQRYIGLEDLSFIDRTQFLCIPLFHIFFLIKPFYVYTESFNINHKDFNS